MIRRPPRSTLFPTRRSSDLVMPVHMAGQVADMDALTKLAADAGVVIVQDAAHAHGARWRGDRKSTRLNSSHQIISYAVFCLKKKKIRSRTIHSDQHTTWPRT